MFSGLKKILIKTSCGILRQQGLTMASKYKVLVAGSDNPPSGIDVLEDKCDLEIWDISKGVSRDELLKRIKGKDALFFRSAVKVDGEVIKAGSELKVLATMSVGLDHVDLEAVRKAGLKLGHTPHVLTEATAELTMALLLATSRRLTEANHALKTGGWTSWSPVWMCGPGLDGTVCGIFGYGRIGKSVARKLKAFNPRQILYTGRKQTKEEENGAEHCQLEELLSKSDFIVVTCPLTAETRNFFNYEKFCRMKPTAVFVNTARGGHTRLGYLMAQEPPPLCQSFGVGLSVRHILTECMAYSPNGVVDQDGLIKALKDKKIAYAGLDVMVPEPIPLDNPLLSMENVVLLPHIGSATTKSRSDMSLLTGLNILAALEGRPMPAEYVPK